MSENDKPADETQPVRPQEPPRSAEAADQPADQPAGPPAGQPAGQPAADPVAAPASAHEASDAAGPAPAPAAMPTAPAATHAPPAPGWGRVRRWRSQQRGDRAFSLGALVASALAGIIVGGVGTAVFHAVTDDHDRGGWVERQGPMGRGGFDDDDRGPMFGGPRGVPGQLAPTTPPEDDDSGSSS